MPISRRQDIRHFLTIHFNQVETPQTVEDCLNAYIKGKNLNPSFHLKKGESKTSRNISTKDRTRLRDQVSQELGIMKQMGLIGRARYGVYVKRLS